MSDLQSVAHQVEPIVGMLRVAGGARLADAAPYAVSLTPPPQVPRSREGERLFLVQHLAGPAPTHLYREIREVTAQTYWSATGSITAALRHAAAAANRHLFHANLHTLPSDRCQGHVACAVLRGEDLFFLHTGLARTCVLHSDRPLRSASRRSGLGRPASLYLECLGHDEKLAPLGIGQLADARLYHAFINPGDTLLMASPGLVQHAGEEAIARVLPRPELHDALAGLEQVGGETDFTALLARWTLQPMDHPDRRHSDGAPSSLQRRHSDGAPSSLQRRHSDGARSAPSARSSAVDVDVDRTPAGITGSSVRSKARRSAGVPFRSSDVPDRRHSDDAPSSLQRRHSDGARSAPSARPSAVDVDVGSVPARRRRTPLQRSVAVKRSLGQAIRSAGQGIAAAGAGVLGGVGTLFRRMLPGPEREARRRKSRRRPPPEENPTVMIAIAVGIPVVVALIVALAYFSPSIRDVHSQRWPPAPETSRFIQQAEQEITLAQAAGGFSEEARPHWEAARDYASSAVERRAEDPVALALQAQAQAALDFLDGILRLQPVHLWDFGPSVSERTSNVRPRQLIVHGQLILVLDTAQGWLAQLTLNASRDGVSEQGDAPILLRTGQQIGADTDTESAASVAAVGSLVDLAWVNAGGERQTSGPVVLEEGGALVSYDPAWVGEAGSPRITRSLLGTPPTGTPIGMASYGGRLYILDADANQLWRYEPRGDVYPEQPDRYFVTPPPKPLESALDVAIDGSIYILYRDGTILKFLGRELQPFDAGGLFDSESQVATLAVDADSGSGAVYVADPGHGCVLALEPDGTLRARFCASEAFSAVEALAVDEAARQLFVISSGHLYAASLP